ncbi:MAG: VWA domain-containing protein, partial [Deltaproteobacteria bacterium]|nr:VWA domain-containing protein [Deltaproteobacteria bacterium]MBW2530451.1 VWA domain-containing protein [Deltaproteobacteria bacterium]
MTLAAAGPLYVGLVWGQVLPESYLRLERPWATLAGLACMSFVALRLSSQRSTRGGVRTALADLFVSLAVLASALAAAGAELGRPLDRLTIIAIVDRSRSIDLVRHAEQRIERELAAAETSMQRNDLIGTVAFAAQAATEEPVRPRTSLPAPQRVDLGRDGTDLGAAIRRALADVPSDSAARLVLLSDGVQTRGDAMAAAAAAVASEIPIDVVPLEQREIPDVRVVSFRATPRAHEHEVLDMRVVVSSPQATEIELRLLRDGKLIRRSRAKVAAGEDVLRLREPAPSSGLYRYDVEVTALEPELDGTAEDNSQSAFVRVRGEARALVLDGDPGKTAFVAQALEAAGIHTEQGSTSSFPADIGAMAAYDVIVFGDIPAHDLSPTQIEALASFVRDLGGGVILTGGDRSMGPGGYSRTPVEEISPVSFDLKQERRRASLAEVIGIDISGSMGMRVGGKTKLELANEAAARSASLLGGGDRLGVEHVDTRVIWSVPLGPVTNKQAIEKAIRSVGPGGGGIFVDITLREAYAALDKESVNLKHVLLFADGADAEQMGQQVRDMVSQAHGRGITTSCVALGQGHDVPELEELSRRGGGRFYIVEDAARLPTIFAQETILASRSAVVEDPFQVAVGASSSVIAGVDFGAAPPLEGYVVTIAKSRAHVMLTGPEDDPVLAVWSAGIGRAAAFTSDLKDRWGGKWTQWPGAARWVAQLARHVSRLEDDARVRLEADTASGQLHLRANVVDDDGHAQSFRRLRVRVSGPDGFSRDVPLEIAGPGAYSATVPLSRPGAYIAVARDEVDHRPVATTGAVMTAGEELRPTGTDFALLSRIAELTAGKRRDTMAGIFNDRAARRFAYQNITTALLMSAALALLLAVAARRLAMPAALARLAHRVRRWRPGRLRAGEAKSGDASETISALLKSREAKQAAPTAVPTSAGGAP